MPGRPGVDIGDRCLARPRPPSPIRSPQVPALCLPRPPPINGPPGKARLGGRPPSLHEPANYYSHRWQEFPDWSHPNSGMHPSELSLRKGRRTSKLHTTPRPARSTPVDYKHFLTENPKKVLKLVNPRAILYECARGACFLTAFRIQVLWMFHMKHSPLRVRLCIRTPYLDPASGCARR